MSKKIAFLSTSFDDLPAEYQGSHAPEEPLDVMYAAAAVGVEARIVQLDEPGSAFVSDADAIALSTTNSYLQWNNHPLGLELFERGWRKVVERKRQDVPTVVFGPHVPAQHARLYELGADHVLLGEAELVVAQLVSTIAAGADPGSVSGLVERGVSALPVPAVVANLDELPCPAYDQTVSWEYNAHNHPQNGKSGHLYECSRGCPYFCSFCNTVTHRRAHRTKSVDKIRADLTHLAGITTRDYVYFVDESFGFRNNWFDDLMPVLGELPFSYGCQGNLSFTSTDKLDAMVTAGFVNVEYGYETANEGVLKRVGKNNRMSKAKDLINYACEVGLFPLLFTQVGLPGDTGETIMESVRFLRGLDSRTRVSIAMPTPYYGTKLWREGVDTGVIPASARGAALYDYTGRIGHGLTFDRDRARYLGDEYGANHYLTDNFVDKLELELVELFGL